MNVMVRALGYLCRDRWQIALAAIAGSTISLLSMAPGQAQVTRRTPMFTNLSISPSFAPDPTYLRGISGGEQLTKTIAGRLKTETGVCIGFVSEKPDHKLTLKRFFDYLNVQVLSERDTVMVIKGPGGTWCSDNRTVTGASVAGQWLPGRYEIWVGTAEANNYAPYSLQITEVE